MDFKTQRQDQEAVSPDLLEATGAIRFVVEEFVKAEKQRVAMNIFTEGIAAKLTKAPWSLKKAQMHDIISTIATSSDMTKFRGEAHLSKFVSKMLGSPFEEKGTCQGIEEANTEELMKCWEISSMELESVQAAAYLERIRKRRELSWVRMFERTEMCHWALHGFFNGVRDCTSRDGVWLFGKARVAVLIKDPRWGKKIPQSMVSPQSEFRWIRLYRAGRSLFLQHVEPWLKASSEEPEWAISNNMCTENIAVEPCMSIPIAGVSITRADWPADKAFEHLLTPPNLAGAGLGERAMKISTGEADIYLLMVAPTPPDTVTLTVLEQLEASSLTTAAWMEEATMHQQDIQQNSGDRTAATVEQLSTSWLEGMPRRTQEYTAGLIKTRVAKHAGSVFQKLFKSENDTINGAASAIVHTHNHFFEMILRSQRLTRPEMLDKVREVLNSHLAGTLFRDSFSDSQQVGQDDIKNLIQRDRLVSAKEVKFAWNYAIDKQLAAMQSKPSELQMTRRLVNEAILHETIRSSGIKIPDQHNYVVFAGKALLALEQADAQSVCCCKEKDLRGLFTDWCSNPLAKKSKHPSSGTKLCCKRKTTGSKNCPSSGYTRRVEDNLNMCIQPPPKDVTISPVEHAFRLIVKPEGAFIQFLAESISSVDKVEWETSVEACATFGHERCRQFHISCRHRVSITRGTALVEGVEQRFAEVGSLSLIVDDMKVRMVPLREGSFVLESMDRWDREMHMRTTLAIWEHTLKEYATLSVWEPPTCKPKPRPMSLTPEKFQAISRGSATDILGITRDLVGALDMGPLLWDVMAYLAWEQLSVLNSRMSEAQHGRSSFVIESPFDVALASLSHAALSECCSMRPSNECRREEELLPLSCTLLYAKNTQVMDGEQNAESVDLNLGRKGWSLLAAMDLDFHLSFSYFRPPTFGGELPKPLLLTGLFWSALPEVLRDFSAAELVEDRKKLLKRHLAHAFRQESIATGKSVKLPYPPIKYESSIAIALTGGIKIGEWAGVESPCEPPKKWSFGYRHRTLGNSWSDQEASEHCLMTQGIISVIGISIHAERCWHLTAGEEEPQEEAARNGSLKKWIEEPEWYDVWRFELFSVLQDGDSLLKSKIKEGTKFVKKLFKSGWNSVTSSSLLDVPDFLQFDDGIQSSSLLKKIGSVSVVELAKALLANPTSFLTAAASGAGAMLGAVGGMLASVAGKVMKVVKDKVLEWAAEFAKKTGLNQVGQVLKLGWNWVKEHVGVDSRMRQCLRVGMTLSRPSYAYDAAPWTKEYEMHYLTFTTLEMRITVPGVVKISAILAYVSDMNLSNYLNMLMKFLLGKETNSRLDACLSCFACGDMKCDKKLGRGSHGSGETHAFCADGRSTEDKRINKKAKKSQNSSEIEDESYEVALTQGVDRCLKASTAEDMCGKPEKPGEEAPPQRLIEIIEDCQSLIPTGAAMS